jgi:hypothetical protein
MKKITLFSLLVLISAMSFAQTATVSGTVTDQKGTPVPFAFIYDSQLPYATYSDSTGGFSFKADPSSRLIATANNYAKTTVKIDNPSDVKIVMSGGAPGNTPIAPSVKNIFRQQEGFENMSEGSLTRIGSHQENIHGSRFLFNEWVHGYIRTGKDSIKQNDAYLYNYDKIDGKLIFATGGTDIHLGVRNEVKQFILFDGSGKVYVFEDAPEVDGQHYSQLIASGAKYKIYKTINTKFIKSDYTNNGITSHGNNYDEFADESDYYLVKQPSGQPQKLSLRKKAIKTAFGADGEKANKFLSDNGGDIDDAYLQKLGEYMNQ